MSATYGIYAVRLRHDAGHVTIRTNASSEDAAIAVVLDAEGAPRRAVVSVKLVKAIPGSGS